MSFAIINRNRLTFPIKHLRKFLFCTNMKNNIKDALENIFPGSFLNYCHIISLIYDKFLKKPIHRTVQCYTKQPSQMRAAVTFWNDSVSEACPIGVGWQSSCSVITESKKARETLDCRKRLKFQSAVRPVSAI